MPQKTLFSRVASLLSPSNTEQGGPSRTDNRQTRAASRTPYARPSNLFQVLKTLNPFSPQERHMTHLDQSRDFLQDQQNPLAAQEFQRIVQSLQPQTPAPLSQEPPVSERAHAPENTPALVQEKPIFTPFKSFSKLASLL